MVIGLLARLAHRLDAGWNRCDYRGLRGYYLPLRRLNLRTVV